MAEWAEPEGRVRALWVARLLNEYGYTQEQVALEVAAGAGRNAERSTVFADIVALQGSSAQGTVSGGGNQGSQREDRHCTG